MKTNRPNYKKKQTKTGFNIQISPTLTTNAAQDIKILNMYLQFGGGCIQKILPEIRNYKEIIFCRLKQI